MGLFTEDPKLEIIPQTKASKTGQDYLRTLLKTQPTVPTQGIAELTPLQQMIQQMLPGYLDKVNQAGDLASGEYSDILSGEYDPRTSPYYEGLRQEAERLQAEGVTGLRQRAELGGMMKGSNAAVAEGSFINQSNSALLTELGRLLETERGRKLLAAEGIQGAESQRLRNVAAVGGIAEEARSIEQQRADALYNQALMQMLFPYQYQANIANSLLNYKQDYAVTGGGMTDLGFGLSTAAQAAGAFIGAGGLTKGAGGAGNTFTNPMAVYGAP
jgi:hypothetical protein